LIGKIKLSAVLEGSGRFGRVPPKKKDVSESNYSYNTSISHIWGNDSQLAKYFLGLFFNLIRKCIYAFPSIVNCNEKKVFEQVFHSKEFN
jgi:hypothetical protein